MKIAVTSQNRKTITEHAGKCRKFWIFNIENNVIVDKTLLELPKEQSFHESPAYQPHPLDDIKVLIAGSMSQNLMMRLAQKDIKGFITKEENPEKAVSLYLSGSLISEEPHEHSHDHSHDHD